VAVNMYQRNALTLKELQSIQSLRDRPFEAAETLLNIIMEQPDAVYLCFLDVLKHTGQHHIYQRLVENGYQGQRSILVLLWCENKLPAACICYVSGQKPAVYYARRRAQTIAGRTLNHAPREHAAP